MRILKVKKQNKKQKTENKNYTPAFESLLTATPMMMSMAIMTAMARAVAMLLLKVDENLNLRLERHVNRAFFFFTVYSFPPGTSFLYFSKYWVASDTKRRGRKGL